MLHHCRDVAASSSQERTPAMCQLEVRAQTQHARADQMKTRVHVRACTHPSALQLVSASRVVIRQVGVRGKPRLHPAEPALRACTRPRLLYVRVSSRVWLCRRSPCTVVSLGLYTTADSERPVSL